jgi:hypothetical protein
MIHFQMVDQSITGQRDATIEQCWRCHTTDHWNNIVSVGLYKHHSGRQPVDLQGTVQGAMPLLHPGSTRVTVRGLCYNSCASSRAVPEG